MDFKNIDEGHPDGETPLHFYYNRAERISKASKLVQDSHSGKLLKKRGFFRVLVSTRGNRMMLLTMLMCFAIVFFVGFFGKKTNETVIDGVPFSLSAFSFEDNIYVSLLLKSPEKKKADDLVMPISVAAEIQTVDADKQIVDKHSVSAKYNGDEQYVRTTFRDYDIISVNADVDFNGKKETLSVKVEHH